jgi:hypothetical protein
MSLTVKELIQQLECMDQDAYVHFTYNYGDHWRTQVAPVVCNVTEGFVQHSDYHRMDKLLDEDDVYDEETGDAPEDARRVVVLE